LGLKEKGFSFHGNVFDFCVMDSCVPVLPAELQLMVVWRIPCSASIADWVSVSRVSRWWREESRVRFTEWVSKQELGKQFGYFAGSKAEIGFVRRHMAGRDYLCRTRRVR
jgi:hypothetical protein